MLAELARARCWVGDSSAAIAVCCTERARCTFGRCVVNCRLPDGKAWGLGPPLERWPGDKLTGAVGTDTGDMSDFFSA